MLIGKLVFSFFVINNLDYECYILMLNQINYCILVYSMIKVLYSMYADTIIVGSYIATQDVYDALKRNKLLKDDSAHIIFLLS